MYGHLIWTEHALCMVHLGLFIGIFVWLIKLMWSNSWLLPPLLLCSSRQLVESCFLHWLPDRQGLPSPPISNFTFSMRLSLTASVLTTSVSLTALNRPLKKQHVLAPSQIWPYVHIYIFRYVCILVSSVKLLDLGWPLLRHKAWHREKRE